MTPFYEETSPTQNDHVTKQMQQLQNVVDENRRRLDCISKWKKEVDEEITKCNKKVSQRVNLLMEYGDIIDDLKKLGQLLEREQCLKEKHIVESEEDRRLRKNLQDRKESVTIKTQSLTSEIKDVTSKLEEARAQYKASQSSRPKPISKPKRNQADLH